MRLLLLLRRRGLERRLIVRLLLRLLLRRHLLLLLRRRGLERRLIVRLRGGSVLLLHLLLLLHGWPCTPVCGGTCPLYATVLCASTPPHVRHGFHAGPPRARARPGTAEGPPLPPPPRAWPTRPFTPADTIPPPAFASDSFFFFDPPAPMALAWLRLALLDFPPPEPIEVEELAWKLHPLASPSPPSFSPPSRRAWLGLAPLAPGAAVDTTEETLTRIGLMP